MRTDTQLQHDVINELDWDASVNAAQVGIAAKDGVVVLTGHVPAYAEKHAAEEAAKRVHGVKAVANEIEIRPTEAHQRDDEDLARAAIHALEWDAHVPHDHVQVAVEQGWITLEGSLERHFQSRAADRAVHHLVGVRGVTNKIVIEPDEAASAMKDSIEAAFRRSATIDSKRVGVEIDGHTVTLTGDVHSHAESEEAVRTAWSARGVHRVANCLTITPFGCGPAEEWGY